MKARRRGRMLAMIAVLSLVYAVRVEDAEGRSITSTTTAGTVTVADMIKDIKDSDLIFVGESHGNAEHHGAQLDVVKGLLDEGVPVSIGLEMIRASDQAALDAWVGGTLKEEEFVPVFSANWGGALWAAYRPIFLFAREKRVPLVGLNVDRRFVNQVSRAGISSLQGGDKPPVKDVKCDASARYQEFIRRMMASHMRHGNYNHFCEAQVLWDAAMAWNLIDYLGRHPDRTVVVLAGKFHSWKHGIPHRVRKQSALVSKVIIPSGPDGPAGHDLTPDDADYVWWFDAERRET